MTQPLPGQPEIEREINLADDPDPWESLPTADRSGPEVVRRENLPTKVWLRLLIWRRIELRAGFITTGHPVHAAISFHLLIWSALLSAGFVAGLCYLVDASIMIMVILPLFVGAAILISGLRHLDRRTTRSRRRRQHIRTGPRPEQE